MSPFFSPEIQFISILIILAFRVLFCFFSFYAHFSMSYCMEHCVFLVFLRGLWAVIGLVTYLHVPFDIMLTEYAIHHTTWCIEVIPKLV